MALEVMVRAAAPVPLDVAFRVEPGELLALVGHSGSGKTTLLRSIAGLWRAETARIAVDGTLWADTARGVALPVHRRRVGVVFQSYALFPHMSAAGNVIAAMDRPDPGEAGRLLDLVGLQGLGARRPGALSGGQQQRVALARALARRPRALLLDEPFSAVDRATRERLHDEIIALRAHLGMPVVLVTHDMNEAQLLADRIVVIEGGRTVRAGTVAEVMTDPAALRAMGLREVAVMLPARIAAQAPDGLTELASEAGPLLLPRIEGRPGMRVRVRVMAHDVILARDRPQGLSAQNVLAGTVARIVPGAGPGVMVHVSVGQAVILARITRRAADQLMLRPGEDVHAVLKSMSIARGHVAHVPGRGP